MANDVHAGARCWARYAVGPLGLQEDPIIDDRTAYGQGLAV
jgi:hypothetical protein